MRSCLSCDLPIALGEPREFIGDEAVHDYCSISTQRTEKVCGICWLIHAGDCYE